MDSTRLPHNDVRRTIFGGYFLYGYFLYNGINRSSIRERRVLTALLNRIITARFLA